MSILGEFRDAAFGAPKPKDKEKKGFVKADFSGKKEPNADSLAQRRSVLGSIFGPSPKKQETKSTENPGAFGSKNSFKTGKAFLYIQKMRKENPEIQRRVERLYPLSRYRSEEKRDKAIADAVLKDPKSLLKNNYQIGKSEKQKIWREETRMNNIRLSTSSGTRDRSIKDLNYKFYEGIMGRDNPQK